jgi:hypothetical protein
VQCAGKARLNVDQVEIALFEENRPALLADRLEVFLISGDGRQLETL